MDIEYRGFTFPVDWYLVKGVIDLTSDPLEKNFLLLASAHALAMDAEQDGTVDLTDGPSLIVRFPVGNLKPDGLKHTASFAIGRYVGIDTGRLIMQIDLKPYLDWKIEQMSQAEPQC